MDMEKLTASIKLHEGTGPVKNNRYQLYVDSTGNTSIGNGINLSNGISQDENDYLTGNRIRLAFGEAQAQPWWPHVANNDARSRAMVEMLYNLGIERLSGFKNAIQCLCNDDFNGAATNLLDSLWHHQVGHRSEVLAQMIMTGADAEQAS